MPELTYKVAIRCYTYNQSIFINDTIDGFVKQKTDFPYIILLVDDASTDGEQDVITDYIYKNFDYTTLLYTETDYAKVISAHHKVNSNCYIVSLLLKYNHFRKQLSKLPYLQQWRSNSIYEALCEGDDYWTDSNKLQRQVDFLESNPDYSMCFHSAFLKKEIKDNYDLDFSNIEDRDYSADELLAKWIVPTASMLYKLEIYNYHLNDRSKFLNGDILLVLQSAFYGRIRGMSDVMSVYRVHSGGVTYNKNIKIDRLKKYPSHYIAIKKNFPFVKRNIINKLISKSFIERATVQNTNIKKIADVLAALKYAPITTIRIIVKEYLKKL